jgi:hypothetical protein
MPSKDYKEDTFSAEFGFKCCKPFRWQEPLKPFVANGHATIFSAKKVKDKICYQHSHINDKQGRYWSY